MLRLFGTSLRLIARARPAAMTKSSSARCPGITSLSKAAISATRPPLATPYSAQLAFFSTTSSRKEFRPPIPGTYHRDDVVTWLILLDPEAPKHQTQEILQELKDRLSQYRGPDFEGTVEALHCKCRRRATGYFEPRLGFYSRGSDPMPGFTTAMIAVSTYYHEMAVLQEFATLPGVRRVTEMPMVVDCSVGDGLLKDEDGAAGSTYDHGVEATSTSMGTPSLAHGKGKNDAATDTRTSETWFPGILRRCWRSAMSKA